MPKRIICVSWNISLGKSRELLLRKAGVEVTSAIYSNEAWMACAQPADLLVLGHSVPREEKRLLIQRFRIHSSAPILSLLSPAENKLPEANYGIESDKPEEVLRVVRGILAGMSPSV